ncbi:DNA internalization-related competence protein ComEC/Rec2 [Staphylospora marina]|uniref:DNA internalization-related competence protein ComEC/Rec2 n=1 Tax=Staphylospora marina TaxID=2490858 RepID=UPI0013DD9527|nr:DNA internalization-related competence protein ComEC/Rec2 [Staphylospora marina]
MKRPFLWIASGWIAGSASVLAGAGSVTVRAGGLALVLSGFLWAFRKNRASLPLILLLAGLLAGAVRTSWEREAQTSVLERWMKAHPEQEFIVRGEMDEPPLVDGDSLRLELVVTGISAGSRMAPVPGERLAVRVRLADPGEQKTAGTWKRKTGMEVKLKLREPSPPRNPGGFDQRAWLLRRGIRVTGEAVGLRSVQLLHVRPGHPMVRIDEWREWLGGRIGLLFPEEHVGLVRALLLGERREVSPETEEAWRELGIVHVLSVSGMHVAILAATALALLKRLGLTRERAAWILILLLPVYAALTGLEPPVVRAAITAGLTLWAMALGKPADALSFLALALLAQLMLEPLVIVEAGFQLTFLVTAAIVTGTRPLAERIPWLPMTVRTAVAATFMATLASFPVVISHFNEFSLLSVPANLLVAPLVGTLALPLASGALLIGLLHTGAGQWAAGLVGWLLDLANAATRWIGTSHALTVWPTPPAWWFPLYAVAAAAMWFTWTGAGETWRLFRRVPVIAFIGVLAWAWWQPVHGDGVRITFLDVGQGDAAVIETESGRVILVDGGGTFGPKEGWRKRRVTWDPGKHVIVPYLKYRGIRQIDELVITHGDLDHIGGLREVVRRFPVRRAIVSGQPPRTEEERLLLGELRNRGAHILSVRPGTGWSLDREVGWRFLYPEPAEAAVSTESNRHSVVFLLEAYGTRVLMTGDADLEAERAILRRWNLPEVHVLKAGHHGSRTSTGEAWLDRLRPACVVISVGVNNIHGHPSPEVLHRLQSRKVDVFRTDRHGAVTVEIRKDELNVRTQLGE